MRTAKRAALGEAHRVLAPAGSLHVADWGRAHDPLLRTAFFVLQLIDGFPAPPITPRAGCRGSSKTQALRGSSA